MSTQRPSWRVVGPADRRVVPWVNGLGTTAVIVRVPDADDWTWRLSLADVATDGPFSSLPGVDRWIAVARGVGMELSVGDDPPLELLAGSDAFAFSGDLPTTCRLVDGPIVDVNLMVRRGAAVGAMSVVSLAAAERLPLDGWNAVVVLEGEATWAGRRLAESHALLEIDAGAPATELAALTSCRLALIRVDPTR